MIDKLILFPYYLTLKIRHGLYNKGIKKVHKADIPTVSIGNVTVGGTGKTPHTELVLKTLLNDDRWNSRQLAVLSRGYKRKLGGFQQVTCDGTALDYGDEPMQIKRKFPFVTVAVDKNRIRGCRFLAHPDILASSKKGRGCLEKNLPESDLVVLDDAFQYRALQSDVSIVLVDYNRPVFKDSLMPMGNLRDLPSRLRAADIIIVTKSPFYMEEEEKLKWAEDLNLKDYDPKTGSATSAKGKQQFLFFTTVRYSQMEPIFPEGETRYAYSPRVVLFTGIANDAPLLRYLSGSYKVIRHLKFPDHHNYSNADIRTISSAAEAAPTAVVATTEKDSQRVKDFRRIPDSLRQRMFKVPITAAFLTKEDEEAFGNTLLGLVQAACDHNDSV